MQLTAAAALLAAPRLAAGPPRPLAPAPSLAIVHSDPRLNVTAAILRRVVTRKSGAAVGPGGQLTLALEIDDSLGKEAYAASFDGQRTASIKGGDPAGVTFGAGAFLRAARFAPAGLTPPQPVPPPPPAAPTTPPVPLSDRWFLGKANLSYMYGACPSAAGCPLAPLLGITKSFEECKQLCLTTNITRCTSCGWNSRPGGKHCYARHDDVWSPVLIPVPGEIWARRFSLPLPTPPLPPPAPPAPSTLQPWSAHGQPKSPGSFRGLYFATHFGNFFANAPPAEIHEYLEDMALCRCRGGVPPDVV